MINILRPTQIKRALFFLIGDLIILAFSYYLSFLLRFDFNFNHDFAFQANITLIPVVLIKIILLNVFGQYKISWKFVSLNEFYKITLSFFIFFIIFFSVDILFLVFNNTVFVPRSIPILDFVISTLLICTFRISKRIYNEILFTNSSSRKKTLIVGANNQGERIARELLRDEKQIFYPYCFVDNDITKKGVMISNIPVYVGYDKIHEILDKDIIEAIIIANPSITHKEIKEIVDSAKQHNISEIKIAPSIHQMRDRTLDITDIRDINVEDLLARNVVQVENNKIRGMIENRSVLITGAGGSIGSEIARQIVQFSPARILCFEIDETELFNLTNELSILNNDNSTIVVPWVGDIRNKKTLDNLFEKEKIDIIFHAAAYKHVPLMEFFPKEAFCTNVMGTYNLAESAFAYGVKKFINISTDKAVNPTSIMGATKRISEMVLTNIDKKSSDTDFISVRFGNVLGSRGSVVPVFLEQIKMGGPVTVTHPEIKRYFMTIPEAVLLVFQAASMGEGGEVFVLDMGEPVKIVSIAEELIKLQNLKPYEDIEIKFTGLRPGEKLFEELLTAEEGTNTTAHEKIYIAKGSIDYDFNTLITKILEIMQCDSDEEIIARIKQLVPFHTDSHMSPPYTS